MEESTYSGVLKLKAVAREKIKQDGKLLDFLEESPSSRFYDSMFSEQWSISEPELYSEMKERHGADGGAYRKMEVIVADLKARLAEDAIVVEICGGVHQNRSGKATFAFKHYFPLDISRSSIRRYCESFDKAGVVADATDLPFEDGSVDCIFTHTFLEHPLQPQKVLEEISRVLKPGGIIVHNDAWFCRWWQRYGIVGLKRFRNMTVRERRISILAWISEIRLFRIPPIVLRRAVRMALCSNSASLQYKRLTPNYDLLLGCDEDAATSLDPIEIMRFYRLKGIVSLKELTLRQQLFHPNEYIMLQKKHPVC